MFREMNRIKQQLTDAECVGLLTSEKRGVLSVLGDGGYPYGTPINHYFKEIPHNTAAHLAVPFPPVI